MEFGSGSSSNSLSSSSSDSLNGLKFGGKIYFENANGPVGSSSASRLVKPPPAPAKKGKVRLGSFGQPPLCQVEGCNVDLSDAKAYYSRHKVCATHSKSPTAIVAGFEQRFCQQCSRFHLISQFDQGKRSCRKRLANHNERRRKPSPGSLFSARHGTLSSQFLESSGRTGSFMLDFSNCSDVSGMDSGPNANMRHCGPENSPTEIDFQGSTARASYSDCTRALSLLSTQPRGSSDESSSFGIHGFVDANGVPVVQSSGSIDSFSSSLYDLKGSECNGGSIERMLPDLGLGGVVLQPDGIQYSEDDLEVVGQYNERDHYVLELEDRRGYDSSSLENMNWFS